MKSNQAIRIGDSLLQQTAFALLMWIGAGLPVIQHAEAATNVVIWDTGSRLADAIDVDKRDGWKAVPSELFSLEADPPKAASDPGYYGREYSFKGDAVVENRSLTAVFWSAKGRVVIYSKADATSPSGASPGKSSLGRKILEFLPLQAKAQPANISRCEILRNAADEVALEVFFPGKGTADVSAVFSFGKTEIVEIKPAEKMKGISLLSSIDYGVAPSFIGDDLIFDPAAYPSGDALFIPAENLFLGLLKGGDDMLVMTWPKGKQQVKLSLTHEQGKPLIQSIDFDNDGQSIYLTALGAPGIWHREELKPSYLEKDMAIQWKRPFPAKWKTQLSEAGVKTAFAFRESKGQVWRGVPGSYIYPAWFDGDSAFFHLSKKVPPKGESLIYFLEGNDTPVSISTPVDILKATLGRPMSDALLDVAGRKLRTHHRRGGDGVHRACTCGCTEAIQAVFEAGEECAKKEFITAALDDMIFFVECHVKRIEEYERFAGGMIKFLRAKGDSFPDLKPFLENLEQVAQQIPQECSVQKENMKSPEYMSDLTRQTTALTSKKDSNNLKAYMDLLKAWRAMGGAQDYVVAQCHTITRKLFQEAGYGCVNQPKAVEVAKEIQTRCRQALRNPDGYEIWANY
jgi:hypothetical protein